MKIGLSDIETKGIKLQEVIETMQGCVVACSGGVDSMLLATFSHRRLKEKCRVVHAVGPAVPVEATERVVAFSKKEGWQLQVIETDEFSDEHYLSNPRNRCFYCKSHLYRRLFSIAQRLFSESGAHYRILSGTNCDDLSEYRPGLSAAEEYGVRHPFIEAGIDKSDIRALSRSLDLSFAELPASPCLASRLYTGTRVTSDRLLAAHFAEEMLKKITGVDVVRCRLQEDDMQVEVLSKDRHYMTDGVIDALRAALRQHHPMIGQVILDPVDYAPGRSFQVPV